jgi:hypothetical protein
LKISEEKKETKNNWKNNMDDNVSQGVNMTVRIFSVGALIIGIVEVKRVCLFLLQK